MWRVWHRIIVSPPGRAQIRLWRGDERDAARADDEPSPAGLRDRVGDFARTSSGVPRSMVYRGPVHRTPRLDLGQRIAQRRRRVAVVPVPDLHG